MVRFASSASSASLLFRRTSAEIEQDGTQRVRRAERMDPWAPIALGRPTRQYSKVRSPRSPLPYMKRYAAILGALIVGACSSAPKPAPAPQPAAPTATSNTGRGAPIPTAPQDSTAAPTGGRG